MFRLAKSIDNWINTHEKTIWKIFILILLYHSVSPMFFRGSIQDLVDLMKSILIVISICIFGAYSILKIASNHK